MISSHVTKTAIFICNICEEESTRICVNCTKDTCANHLCEKCGCCSDCCSCELSLNAATVRDPEPHPHPMPDPDPAPDPEPIPTFPMSRFPMTQGT
jgi:hypothetical protein